MLFFSRPATFRVLFKKMIGGLEKMQILKYCWQLEIAHLLFCPFLPAALMVRALFLPIISDSRARSLGKNDLHTTSAISLA